MMTAIQNLTLNLTQKGDSTGVNDYIDKNAKFDWNESKEVQELAGKDAKVLSSRLIVRLLMHKSLAMR